VLNNHCDWFDILQGSVATCLKCGGIFNDHFIANIKCEVHTDVAIVKHGISTIVCVTRDNAIARFTSNWMLQQ